jgi:hypothetical protein
MTVKILEKSTTLPSSDYLSREPMEGHKMTLGVACAFIAAVVVIIQGVVAIVYGETLIFMTFQAQALLGIGLGIGLTGIFGTIIGVCLLGGAYVSSSNGLQIIGGIVVIIFSLLSILAGGGWFLGVALGIFGGTLSLFKK